MAIAPFLAMTAAEIRKASPLPEKIAWMACHFSPYGAGLSNLPKTLQPGSLLMVDDVTPPYRHRPTFIAEQLSQCVESLQCRGVLLDFQRRGCEETHAIAKQLVAALPCPVAVSACYAAELDCPVFLPPVPPSVPLEAHLAPWEGRQIWLEPGLDGEVLTLTKGGCEEMTIPNPDENEKGFEDLSLHCHYSVETTEKSARFTFWRTKDDLERLLNNAKLQGVSEFIGLFQEMKTAFPNGTREE